MADSHVDWDFLQRRAAFKNNELVQEYPDVPAGIEAEENEGDQPLSDEDKQYLVEALGFDPDEYDCKLRKPISAG